MSFWQKISSPIKRTTLYAILIAELFAANHVMEKHLDYLKLKKQNLHYGKLLDTKQSISNKIENAQIIKQLEEDGDAKLTEAKKCRIYQPEEALELCKNALNKYQEAIQIQKNLHIEQILTNLQRIEKEYSKDPVEKDKDILLIEKDLLDAFQKNKRVGKDLQKKLITTNTEITNVNKLIEIKLLADITYGEAAQYHNNKKAITAIASTVLNRVESKRFPNKIRDVIFQKNQYYATRNPQFKLARENRFLNNKIEKNAYQKIYKIAINLYFGKIKRIPGEFFITPKELQKLIAKGQFDTTQVIEVAQIEKYKILKYH